MPALSICDSTDLLSQPRAMAEYFDAKPCGSLYCPQHESRSHAMRMRPSLLVPILLLSLTAAGAAEPQGDKPAGTVDVHLSEYAIQMPQTLPAGPTTFVVHNDGKKIHSFRI